MEGLRSSRRPHSCKSKACIGIIRLTKDMKRAMVYRSKFFSFLSWIQCFLAVIMMAIYVVLYGEIFLQTPDTDPQSQEDPTLFIDFGGGILVSGIQILAAATTLLVVDESNYCWLHTAMSFHILSVFGNFLVSLHMLMVIFPGFSLKMVLLSENTKWDISKSAHPDNNIQNLRHTLLTIVTVLSLASVFLGSFLGSATGYGVFCGADAGGKRKSSSAELKDRIRDSKQSKFVKFKTFEPTNVAANLGVEQFTSFENYMHAKEDSIIYINRHALNKSNSTDA